jgi:hypothetical protein
MFMKKRLVSLILLQLFWLGPAIERPELVQSRAVSDCEGDALLCVGAAQLSVIPALPVISDEIQITAAGVSPNACVPVYQSYQVLGNAIRIDAIVDASFDTLCAEVLTPWEFTVEAGQLPAATYQIELYLADHRYTQVPSLWASGRFVVFHQLRQAFVPIVRR